LDTQQFPYIHPGHSPTSIRPILAASCGHDLPPARSSIHLHAVLSVEPDRVKTWFGDDIQARWARVMRHREGDFAPVLLPVSNERLAPLRTRLSVLSWFMHCLNEPIARRANAEDQVTGRIWEGRFRCQLLLAERAVLAALAYVYRNPVRAGMTDTLAGSDHTAIQRSVISEAVAEKMKWVMQGAICWVGSSQQTVRRKTPRTSDYSPASIRRIWSYYQLGSPQKGRMKD
jgi:hypothetical protein